MTNNSSTSAEELIDDAIAELEARLNLEPGQGVAKKEDKPSDVDKKKNVRKKNSNNNAKNQNNKEKQPNLDQPDICKLEFKVGRITKVWVHEKADKLYCEEIDVGESIGPRQIASGLRPHFTEEQMLGQRLLVVTNLKPKNLVGFKSHGMVLCAACPAPAPGDDDRPGDGEKVEFVEPPPDAPIGEVVAFQGLPPPEPLSAAQVEKRKVFAACLEGMKTTDDEHCIATWNGHTFVTSAGPCKAKTIRGGCLR